MTTLRKYKQTIVITSIISISVLFTIFYMIPFVISINMLDGTVFPIYEGGKMVGIKFVSTNLYFLPIVLNYNGADVVVDIYDKDGDRLHRANFLSVSLHDDEEGYKHIARLPVGDKVFQLNFNESSQYYRNNTIPSLPAKEYILMANAFGKEIYSE